MKTFQSVYFLVLIISISASSRSAAKQEQSKKAPPTQAPPTQAPPTQAIPTQAIPTQADANQEKRFKKFAKDMSGVKLIGTFTIDGRKGSPVEEEYTIEKVEKSGDGDLWTFTARIKYGTIDVPVPLTIPVKWAGNTPMVSISNFRIPLVGSGAFGARVMFYEGKYAGTWSHDQVGGHMFGRIEKIKKKEADRQPTQPKSKSK